MIFVQANVQSLNMASNLLNASLHSELMQWLLDFDSIYMSAPFSASVNLYIKKPRAIVCMSKMRLI